MAEQVCLLQDTLPPIHHCQHYNFDDFGKNVKYLRTWQFRRQSYLLAGYVAYPVGHTPSHTMLKGKAECAVAAVATLVGKLLNGE